ncbi:cysteine dioxygenase family protein [Streptomyces gardneri]|uniref:cysteine dioxygenase n=1 Tax=Nocardia TaxID=1817 RepID=UPI00135C3C69|nr:MULTISPECIES: cysteine dioxygenase family protein [Nocardia]MBF6163187.1 cysteine dioxygenase family protein [Streptomyces gardneri]MBF6202829.1 cysteine dioxygenase family protein [Streptomyces gardneri]UAK29733.1 cysteine dioxygenase family protein [Nocardia asteroides]
MTTSLPVNLKHARDIHPGIDLPVVRDALHPDRALWSPAQLQRLTSEVAAELATPLLDIARFDPQQRWWTRLALTMGVELWLLSWAPGQGTEPHDHGGASGAFTMTVGELREEYLHLGGQVRKAQRRAGDTVAFGPDRAHQLRNDKPWPAASVHAYSPPLRPVREYRTLTDFTGTSASGVGER